MATATTETFSTSEKRLALVLFSFDFQPVKLEHDSGIVTFYFRKHEVQDTVDKFLTNAELTVDLSKLFAAETRFWTIVHHHRSEAVRH